MNDRIQAYRSRFGCTLRALFCAVAMAGIGSPVFAQKYFNVGKWDTAPDSATIKKGEKTLVVRQRLPVGDDMSVYFTSDGAPIINKDGSLPGFMETVPKGYDGLVFDHIPPIINGKRITDLYQKHSASSLRSGILQLAAFDVEANMFTAGESGAAMFSLGDWLDAAGYSSGNMLWVPDFLGPSDTIYYSVDAAVWCDFARSMSLSRLSEPFEIVDGVSPLLPGFLFGTSAATVGADGWVSDSLFTGTVERDSYHEFTSVYPVPESSVFGVGAILGCGLAVVWRIRKKVRQGFCGD